MRKLSTLLVLATLMALFTYGFDLGSPNAPSIGDEGPYLQVTRVMAAQGTWLPVRAEEAFLHNTKPPALFWQGIVTTDWGRDWNLVSLRWPLVLYTFLNAGLVAWAVILLGGTHHCAISGGLIYLGFLSTFQQGRTFLMHPAEVFFLFLPLVLWLRHEGFTKKTLLLTGLSLGIAALYKSFLVMLPAIAALGLLEWRKSGNFLAASARLAAVTITGLAVFALWFALDPEPGRIWQDFIVGQNAKKFTEEASYFKGLFTGAYPVVRIWFGNLTNGALYAPLLIALAALTLRNRRVLPPRESALWIYVLTFLAVYTLPSQRQENYLLPTTAALAALLGLHCSALPTWVFRLTHGLVLCALGLVFWVILLTRLRMPSVHYTAVHLLVPALFLVLGLLQYFGRLPTRVLLPFSILAVWLSVSLVLSPFGRPMTISAPVAQVAVPENFPAKRERFRFLIPAAEFRGYNARQAGLPEELLAQGETVALYRPFAEELPPEWEILGETLDVRTRHSGAQIRQILFDGKIDLLFNRLLLVRRRDRA